MIPGWCGHEGDASKSGTTAAKAPRLAALSLSAAIRIASRPIHGTVEGSKAAGPLGAHAPGRSLQQSATSSVAPRLQVTSPSTYGQVLDCQHPTRIAWTSQVGPRGVRPHCVQILLLKNKEVKAYIASRLQDVGTYLWTPPRHQRSDTYKEGVWLRGPTEDESAFQKRVLKQNMLRTPDGQPLPAQDMCAFMHPEYSIRVQVLSVKDAAGYVTELAHAAASETVDEDDALAAQSQPFFLVGKRADDADGSSRMDARGEAARRRRLLKYPESRGDSSMTVVYPRGSDVRLRPGKVSYQSVLHLSLDAFLGNHAGI